MIHWPYTSHSRSCCWAHNIIMYLNVHVRELLSYLCIGATALRNAAQFGRGIGPIWLAQVGCTLDDTSLTNCTLGIPIGTNRCNHGQDAGVICFTNFSK